MPIPAELEGKKLVGSTWIRRLGKHRGFRWVMIGFNEAGVKLRPDKNDLRGWKGHMGDQRITSLQWPMFLNLYEAEGKLDMLVTTDKEGIVLTVEREKTAVNGIVPPKASELIGTKICKGPGHYKGGKGTPVPDTEFKIVENGPRIGKVALTCNSCLTRQRQWERDRKTEEGRVKVSQDAVIKLAIEATQEPVVSQPVDEPKYEPIIPVITSPGKRWKVTIIPAPKPIVVEVEADDFLSAGIAAGEGEVIRVERL